MTQHLLVAAAALACASTVLAYPQNLKCGTDYQNSKKMGTWTEGGNAPELVSAIRTGLDVDVTIKFKQANSPAVAWTTDSDNSANIHTFTEGGETPCATNNEANTAWYSSNAGANQEKSFTIKVSPEAVAGDKIAFFATTATGKFGKGGLNYLSVVLPADEPTVGGCGGTQDGCCEDTTTQCEDSDCSNCMEATATAVEASLAGGATFTACGGMPYLTALIQHDYETASVITTESDCSAAFTALCAGRSTAPSVLAACAVNTPPSITDTSVELDCVGAEAMECSVCACLLTTTCSVDAIAAGGRCEGDRLIECLKFQACTPTTTTKQTATTDNKTISNTDPDSVDDSAATAMGVNVAMASLSAIAIGLAM